MRNKETFKQLTDKKESQDQTRFHKFTATIYLEDGEKAHSGYYTRLGMIQVVKKLRAEKQVFSVWNWATQSEEQF